jgi:hypothetical protein
MRRLCVAAEISVSTRGENYDLILSPHWLLSQPEASIFWSCSVLVAVTSFLAVPIAMLSAAINSVPWCYSGVVATYVPDWLFFFFYVLAADSCVGVARNITTMGGSPP